MIIIPKREWGYPWSYERSYDKTLRAYVSQIEKAMEEEIPAMEDLAKDNGVKMDSYESDLTALLDKIGAKVDKNVSEAALKKRIQSMYKLVNDFNDKEFHKAIKEAVGISDFFINEKWQQMYKAVWIQDNLSLIKSIKQRTLENIRYDLGELIATAQNKQLRAAQLTEMIQNITDQNYKRAHLIARDQIGKLNGRLTQLRQQSAGIKRYKWSTSRDERVRPAHAEREGKIFEWDNPPFDGNPGYPIQCRCVAIPVIDTSELGISTEESVTIREENAALPSKLAGVKRGDPMDETEADEGRPNPNFEEDHAYQINCQSCVVTYEARRRGYNVQTLPNYEEEGGALYRLSKDTRLAWIDPLTGEKPEFIPHPKTKTIDAYLRWLDTAVEKDKRYTLQILWRVRGGHIVHVRKDINDKLEIYDPQTGKIYTRKSFTDTRENKTYDVNMDMVEFFLRQARFYVNDKWEGPELLRVDDKQFNLDVVNKIMEKYGGEE